MKKMMIMVMMMTIAVSANAMTYSAARNEALFLSDKMAYELGLTDAQYEAVYEINLDYLLNMNTSADVLGPWWDVRNRDLRLVLSTWQYDRYLASHYFYRPLTWVGNTWAFSIYSRYAHDRMFHHRPAVFVSFRGGHSHRGVSFYAGHHFDRPVAHVGHGSVRGHGPSMGHGGHGPAKGNVGHSSMGHGGHGPSGHMAHSGGHGPKGGRR